MHGGFEWLCMFHDMNQYFSLHNSKQLTHSRMPWLRTLYALPCVPFLPERKTKCYHSNTTSKEWFSVNHTTTLHNKIAEQWIATLLSLKNKFLANILMRVVTS